MMNSTQTKNIALLLVGLALGVAVTVVMSMSYQDAITEQERYCSMVKDGAWPDFNKNYAEVCKEE